VVRVEALRSFVEKAGRLKINVLRRFAPEEVLDTTYKGGSRHPDLWSYGQVYDYHKI
jgi:hypothetical protein